MKWLTTILSISVIALAWELGSILQHNPWSPVRVFFILLAPIAVLLEAVLRKDWFLEWFRNRAWKAVVNNSRKGKFCFICNTDDNLIPHESRAGLCYICERCDGNLNEVKTSLEGVLDETA